MDYWFPARPSGFGWGPPVKWSGWIFLVGWGLLLVSGIRATGGPSFSSVVFLTGMIGLLLVVLFFKGERRRLR
jgi:hypothetical protein